jgi:hypothetical protein
MSVNLFVGSLTLCWSFAVSVAPALAFELLAAFFGLAIRPTLLHVFDCVGQEDVFFVAGEEREVDFDVFDGHLWRENSSVDRKC